jgi:hypothetical protein
MQDVMQQPGKLLPVLFTAENMKQFMPDALQNVRARWPPTVSDALLGLFKFMQRTCARPGTGCVGGMIAEQRLTSQDAHFERAWSQAPLASKS